jgi:hypothetical protein
MQLSPQLIDPTMGTQDGGQYGGQKLQMITLFVVIMTKSRLLVESAVFEYTDSNYAIYCQLDLLNRKKDGCQ